MFFLSVTHSFLDVVTLITVSVTPNLPSLSDSFLLPAVRYLGSLEAFVSCSTGPQSSMVIGWREKESKSLRVTSFFTKRGVWDMDHHRGLNLIGGDRCVTRLIILTCDPQHVHSKLVLFILPKTCVGGPYNLYKIRHPEAGQYHLKSMSHLIATFTSSVEYSCAQDSPSSKRSCYSLCCK